MWDFLLIASLLGSIGYNYLQHRQKAEMKRHNENTVNKILSGQQLLLKAMVQLSGGKIHIPSLNEEEQKIEK